MYWLFDPAVIFLGIAAASLAAVLVLSFGAGVRHQIGFDRLPAAARLGELEVLVGGREAELQEVTEKLQRAEVALAVREKAELEAEYWRTAAETAKAEYDALSDLRREIEDVREEYRQALEELTLAEGRLREQSAAADHAQARVDAAEKRLEEIASDEHKLTAQQADLKESVEELESRLAALKQEKSEVGVELERAKEQSRALYARMDELEAAVARLTDEKARAEAAIEDTRVTLANLEPAKAEVERVQGELSALSARRDELERSLDEKEAGEGRLMARIERLREELSDLDGTDTGKQADDKALADLTKPPACLAHEVGDGRFEIVMPHKRAEDQELDALQRVMKHLQESGLDFPKRTVDAFHTCLKTAVISPLTVLAGISGTGKSQLPRYYAEAMGVHFLKVPVQPRWDGPQDLFGFYNYIEKKYKATDLARALVHLDSDNWETLSGEYKDRMLLVLLDEMNLARVEYYFSEFLSRLEGRPFDESSMTADERRPSEIDIDVSQAGQGKRVYVGQNVLFVGTMNEDESTLALSDKVLDRANVLRFPKPVKLEEALPSNDRTYVAKDYLPKSRWTRSWIRAADKLDGSQRARASKVVGQINEVMNELGRPFGHRMGQAMLHYVANYPAAGNRSNNMDQVNFALADQIEQRILPRLRGLIAEEHSRALRNLSDIANNELQDGVLAKEIENAVQRSRESNGLFVWRGFTRQSK